jgi:very-short-patch-repair endonuclease
LARRQHNVIARWQLTALGYTKHAIDHRLASGRLHVIFRGVYAIGRPEVSRHGFLMAAVLACGGRAALSHFSAGEVYGICQPHRGDVHISLAGSERRVDGITVHRRANMRIVRRHGLPLTTPVDTLIDMTAAGANIEAAVNNADKLDVIHVGDLREALEHIDPRPGVPALKRLIDIHTFVLTDTELERWFLPIARRAGLPKPLSQVWLNGGRVDFYFPDLRIVVECDGGRYHRTPMQQTNDAVRFQRHAVAELIPLRFTHWQIRYDPKAVEHVLRTVAARVTSVAG